MVSSSVDSETGFKNSSALKASEKILCEKLEKEMKKAIMEVMKVELYDGNVNIDQNQLYFILDNL